MNQKILIALVGCGRISNRHIEAISYFKDRAQIEAICDPNSDRLNNALIAIEKAHLESNHSKPLLFSDYEDLISNIKNKKIDIDLIVLATPSGLHPKQTILAAEAGVNVCTEKPMATNWEDGKLMVKECQRNEVKLFVVKQNRYNSTLQLVKKQLDKKRFGKLSLVTVNVFWQRPQSYYDQDEWRGTKKMDGGALMNQASHYVDLLDWLIGPVESLSASTATIGRSIEAEDTAVVQIRWKNGALGTMGVTMLAYPNNLEGSICILGEKGSVKIGGPAVNKIELWKFANKDNDDNLIQKASYETTSIYGFGHVPYYKNMINYLSEQDAYIVDGSEGLRSLELLSAAYKSSQIKKIINLPLN